MGWLRDWFALIALGAAVSLTGCTGGDEDSDFAKSVTGPGITVHCNGQTPRAVGDTTTIVRCPPAVE
jgi:hypothetical protein